MTRSARVGIYGGTFNPIHLGHLRAAEEVAEALDLSRVVFVPSAQPPHKQASPDDPIAPAADRLAWVRAAVEGNPRFAVDSIEVDRGGASYAVETLRCLGRDTAPERPVFIIGQDAFAEIGSWREPAKLLQLAHFAVTSRPPVAGGSLADWLPESLRPEVEIASDGRSARHRSAGTWIRVLQISLLDISSSEIRSRIRAGRSVRYLLPEPVREAIARDEPFGPSAPREKDA